MYSRRQYRLILLFAAAVGVLGAGSLPAQSSRSFERFDSGPLPSSGVGVRFSFEYASDWEFTQTGERVRLVPPQVESRRESPVRITVIAIAKDDKGSESLLGEPKGLLRWLAATRPRYLPAAEDTIAVGPKKVLCPRVLLTDPGRYGLPDVRVEAVLVEQGDVYCVILCEAPMPEVAVHDRVFHRVIESFEARG